MKVLLDTHVWIWSQLAPERIARSARTKLSASTTELWLSPISVWELLWLSERGRVQLRPSGREWADTFFAKVPVREPALTREVVAVSREIDVAHEDPCDRFLAATAAVYGLTLCTADERLLSGTGYRVLPAG